jgi:hypothetical protein
VLIVSGIAALAMALGAAVLHGDGDDQDDELEPNLSVAAVTLDTSPMPPRRQVSQPPEQ